MSSRAGLKQIVLCDSGTLLTTPSNPIAAGLRNAAAMERTPFKEVKDYRNRILKNMVNFKIEWESLQPTMLMLKSLVGWINLNCDAQVVTVPQSSGGSGDVYQFAGVNKAGLDFEYVITADKRSLKPTLEVAMEYERAKTFIDSADNNSPITFANISGDGADFPRYRAPYYLSFEAPKTAAVFGAPELVERSYSIKTKNKKSIYNSSIVDYLAFEFSIAARDASIVKQIEAMSKDASPSVYIKEQNSGSFYDAFDFTAGILTLHDEFKDGDDDRNLKLVFSADVPVSDIAFQFGAAYGGDSTDAGVKGGTMRIGY
jgi:hypothetical protein